LMFSFDNLHLFYMEIIAIYTGRYSASAAMLPTFFYSFIYELYLL